MANLHPRNKHTGRYDLEKLCKSCPALKPFLIHNPSNELTIDFSNPSAVRTLNEALLKSFYPLDFWQIPSDFLCPPIPGRSDYIHHLADLLGSCNQGNIPLGDKIKVLDIGVGSSCIYPMIGKCEYGWSFVGTDIDPIAIESAQRIIDSNPELKNAIEIRIQPDPQNLMRGILRTGEKFDLTICNPPFHKSLEEAQAGSQRKWNNLGKKSQEKPLLNFGGQNAELWCPGGEVAFITRMIAESNEFRAKSFWFSTIVSKMDVLPEIYALLKKAKVNETRTVEMSQGQKKSRFVAWTFWGPTERAKWHWTCSESENAKTS